jgi:hypothetical protein
MVTSNETYTCSIATAANDKFSTQNHRVVLLRVEIMSERLAFD